MRSAFSNQTGADEHSILHQLLVIDTIEIAAADIVLNIINPHSEAVLPYHKCIPLEDVEQVRVVIVQRYVGESPEGFYYPYAGTLYPIGIPGSRKLIEFTPSLIEKVVRHGYSDEQEDAYVYLMKRELMLERGLHSMGFADKKEREAYREYLKGVNAL